MRERKHPVHPRARGEHILGTANDGLTYGSSPRTRGTQACTLYGFGSIRFIPAHAGNTGHPRPGQHPDPVHPRARGEHKASSAGWSEATGSSPRTRGTPKKSCRFTCGRRFIPAHAGNTGEEQSSYINDAVHPRARGEHEGGAVFLPDIGGSSPRTRGTLSNPLSRRANFRFIPAHAGNTAVDTSIDDVIPVHPRARGEHTCRPQSQ